MRLALVLLDTMDASIGRVRESQSACCRRGPLAGIARDGKRSLQASDTRDAVARDAKGGVAVLFRDAL